MAWPNFCTECGNKLESPPSKDTWTYVYVCKEGHYYLYSPSEMGGISESFIRVDKKVAEKYLKGTTGL